MSEPIRIKRERKQCEGYYEARDNTRALPPVELTRDICLVLCDNMQKCRVYVQRVVYQKSRNSSNQR